MRTTTLGRWSTPTGTRHRRRAIGDGQTTADVLDKKGASTLADFSLLLDPVGNPTRLVRTGSLAQTQTYGYDRTDRLTSVCFQAGTCPGSADPFIRFTYDGLGKRLQASTGSKASQKTSFLWDVNQALPQLAIERDGSGSLLRRYTYGLGRISMTSGSSPSYYLTDGLGSVTNLTSSSGATQWTWSYEPFGGTRTEQKASGKQPTNLMRFAGEYADPTGLYHLRARQYDPASGRFLSRDPLAPALGDPSLSAYAYAGNVPTLYVDPSGESLAGTYECARHPVRCVENAGPVARARATLNQSVAAGLGAPPPSPPVVATPPPPYATSTLFGSPSASASFSGGTGGEVGREVARETLAGAIVVGSLGCVVGALSGSELGPAGMAGLCIVSGLQGVRIGGAIGGIEALERYFGPLR